MCDSSAHNIIYRILDLLFPPTDQARRIQELSSEDLPKLPSCRSLEKPFIRAVCDYRDETVRDVVYACKFGGVREAYHLIGSIMQTELLAICQEERIFSDKIVITSIPLTRARKRKRGFNQSRRICQAVVKCDESDTFRYKSLLKKVRKTADQTELSKSQRRKNVRGVFQAKEEEITAEVVFVIDDVTTTGATLTEARRALSTVTNTKIIGVAFGH